MVDDPTIAEQAVNRWQSHLEELDEVAMMGFADAAKRRVCDALDVPSPFIGEITGAYGKLGDARWAGSLIVRTTDESVEVLVEPVQNRASNAQPEVRQLLAIVGGEPFGPPFEDELGLGRALEEGQPYEEWLDQLDS